jgi:hypothetical protein
MKRFFPAVFAAVLVVGSPVAANTESARARSDAGTPRLVVVIPVDYESQLPGAAVLAESIRTFGGSMNAVPIRLYLADRLHAAAAAFHDRMTQLAVEMIEVQVPDIASQYILGAKPFMAAQAEADTEGEFDLLAVLAPNTIVLAEPHDLLLPQEITLGFSPVHHQNIGSPYDEPADAFWSRLYRVLEVPDDRVFPIVSLADRKTLRFYFNAGSFVVRPEAGLLRAWADAFTALASDPTVADLCREGKLNVFLHQAALAGTAVKRVERVDTLQLPDSYSYPLFFERFFGGDTVYDSLQGVVTMRYEFRIGDLPAGWQAQIEAPEGVIPWIEEHLTGS